ncbi:MAG: Asp23/Gls24 family envelope stress response protein [Lachnospiraceae bacterium]|nr:Asp23/Gls24 family envelope stress response protein [Lachnospiraceae bacterium]MBR1649776.1 Asp23/Gls24 family envelope stress response protein [Lachnospiraceae bacterium]
MAAQTIINRYTTDRNKSTTRLGGDPLGGEILIADDVVAMIAALAASETDGVSNVGNTYTSELMSKVGVHDKTMGVKVDIRENIVRVSLAITIMNGFAIPDISQQVQKKVKNSVENMTGMTVKSVNVRVIDVEV